MKLTQENREEIRTRFASIVSVDDLAQLLNWIYTIKFPRRSKKTNVSIEEKHLNYYAFVKENRYKQFSLKKKSGGIRSISSPRYKLKTIQKCINEILNSLYIPNKSATGFVPKKSIVDNAKLHVGKQYVFNTDLKDFFPSTDFRRVKTVLGFRPFNLIDENEKQKTKEEKGRGFLGFLIANLCCENGCLPQGAPTSPTLTNIVCQRLDKKLYKYAKSIKANYSRYADDITFSSNKPIFDEKFNAKLIEIIEVEENFKINFDKERLQHISQRQSVTGLIVNKKCNVDRPYIKDVRFWLMCWTKFNADATQQKFTIQFPDKKGFLRYDGATPQFYDYLKGKILFLGMVRGQSDSMYLKFKNEYDNLYNKMNGKEFQTLKNASNENNQMDLGLILNIWETKGFEKAMDKIK